MAEKKESGAAPREEVLAEAVAPSVAGGVGLGVDAGGLSAVKTTAKSELKAEEKAHSRGGEQGVDSDLHVNVEVAAALSVDRDLLLSPIGRLESWASLLPQTEGELLAELGGGYLFFLGGDALVLHLLRRRHLDADLPRGFQALRLLYQAERLLERMHAAGAHFRLVFFRAFERVNVNGVFAAMANQLRLHLRLRGIPFLFFEDWFDPRFAAAVDELHPLFFLLSDVHFPALEEELTLPSEALAVKGLKKERKALPEAWRLPEDAPPSSVFYQTLSQACLRRDEGRLTSFLLQSLMLRCCSLSLDLAFLRDLVVKSTKIFAPSASCYAGANIWRAMELRLQTESQRRAEGASPEAESEEFLLNELEKNLADSPCPLDAAFASHGAMMEDIFAERPLRAVEGRALEDLFENLEKLDAILKKARAPAGEEDARRLSALAVRLLFALRFVAGLKERGENGKGGEESTAAFVKLLVLSAFTQFSLGLRERGRVGVAVGLSGSAFEGEFLLPRLAVFFEEAAAVFRSVNDALEARCEEGGKALSSASEVLRRAEEILAAGGEAVPDFFDGKLFVSLAASAGSVARTAGSWSLSAQEIGLAEKDAKLLEAVWKFLASKSAASSAAFQSDFFPLSLEALRVWLQDEESAPQSPLKAEASAASAEGEAASSANVVALSSSFLRRLRAGGPRAGELPGVSLLDDADEEREATEKELREELKVDRRREKEWRSARGLEVLEEDEADSEDEEQLGELDAYKFHLLLEVRNAVFDARAEFAEPSAKDPPSEVSLCSSQTVWHRREKKPSLFTLQKKSASFFLSFFLLGFV